MYEAGKFEGLYVNIFEMLEMWLWILLMLLLPYRLFLLKLCSLCNFVNATLMYHKSYGSKGVNIKSPTDVCWFSFLIIYLLCQCHVIMNTLKGIIMFKTHYL